MQTLRVGCSTELIFLPDKHLLDLLKLYALFWHWQCWCNCITCINYTLRKVNCSPDWRLRISSPHLLSFHPRLPECWSIHWCCVSSLTVASPPDDLPLHNGTGRGHRPAQWQTSLPTPKIHHSYKLKSPHGRKDECNCLPKISVVFE